MQAVGKSSIVVALVASVCVMLGGETAVSGPRCQLPTSGAIGVFGPVKPPNDPAAWKCPSFDPMSGGPRHAYFVTRDKNKDKKKGKKYVYKNGGYFVPTFNTVHTYKCKASLKRPGLCDK